MMAVIRIVAPLKAAVVAGSLLGFDRVGTPDPKEAGLAVNAGVHYIDLDFGAPRAFDTVLVGYTSDDGSGHIDFQCGMDGPTETGLGTVQVADADGVSARHFLLALLAPVTARYLRVSRQDMPPGYTIGVVAAGLSFQPIGYDLGSGRTLIDTGSATRLFGGGFGIDEGVCVGGFEWTMSDLSDAELRQLWALARSRGNSRTGLVIENPDQTPGLNERIHWGMFGRFDRYERIDPNLNRWSWSILDWA